MSGGINIVADTNLIILGIGGAIEARELMEGRALFISVITEIELLSIPFANSSDERLMREFISDCTLIELDSDVRREAIKIRKNTKRNSPTP